MSRRQTLEKRLSSYWKMEIGNAAFLPITMIALSHVSGSPVGLMSYFALIPMIILLLVGGLYWRAKYLLLIGKQSSLSSTLAVAHYAQGPIFILILCSIVWVGFAWAKASQSMNMGDLIVATIAASLAGLEYVNYYHRQLQHFDHSADFKRLLSGRGFRHSQMSSDLKKWRSAQKL